MDALQKMPVMAGDMEKYRGKGRKIKEKMQCLSIGQLKIIACVLMFLDHFAAVFGIGGHDILPFDDYWFRAAGRIVFPIFAFALINGWQYTSDKERYILHMGRFACLSQIPFVLALDGYNGSVESLSDQFVFRLSRNWPVNAILVLALGLLLWACHKRISAAWPLLAGAFLSGSLFAAAGGLWITNPDTNVGFQLLAGLLCFYAADYIQTEEGRTLKGILLCMVLLAAAWRMGSLADYGRYGLALFAALYLLKDRPVFRCCAGVAWALWVYGGDPYYAMAAACGFLLTLLYNGKKGRPSGKFFYIFYPAHLLVLGAAAVGSLAF